MHLPVYNIRTLFSNVIQLKSKIEGSELENFQFTSKEKHLNYPMLTSSLPKATFLFKCSSISTAKTKDESNVSLQL